MKTKEFLDVLAANPNKSLVFEYKSNHVVPANYHITEVKHVTIDSVDCGAQSDSWKETIIQLWESPTEIDKTEFMSSFKALEILKKVGTIKPYKMDAEVKMEYGNSGFHTAQMFINDFDIEGEKLIIKLGVEKTDCKAKEVCGVTEPVQEALVNSEPCCSPNGNCC